MVINIHDAKTHFSKLLERVARGEEVVIARAGHPIARLVAYEPPKGSRRSGAWKGLVRIGSDFDAPLPAEWVAAFGSVDPTA
jgi:prevent-host-death family protein